MERRKKKTRDLNEQIYLPIWLINKIQKHENWIEVIALYIFYFGQALRQRTNQPWATDEYCWKGLKIGKSRFQNAKKVLKRLHIITSIQSQNQKGIFSKTYIRLNLLENDLSVRSHQTRPPMENKGCEDGDALSLRSGIQGNPAVGEFPDASKPPSNAKEFNKISASASAGDLRPPLPLYGEKCNKGLIFGVDTDQEEDKRCESCSGEYYRECIKLKREHTSPKISAKAESLLKNGKVDFCPYEHIFGADTDRFPEDCDNCPNWDECIKRLEQKE